MHHRLCNKVQQMQFRQILLEDAVKVMIVSQMWTIIKVLVRTTFSIHLFMQCLVLQSEACLE